MFEKPERRLSLQELGLKNKEGYSRQDNRASGGAGTNHKRIDREEANRDGMNRGERNREGLNRAGMNRAGMNMNRERKAKKEGNGWLDSLLHNDNLLKLMVAGIVVSVGLIFWGKGGGPETPAFKPVAQTLPAAKDNAGGSQIGALEQALENRLADNLSQISGVGQVKVMVTLGTGLKSDYGKNASVTKNTTEETDKTGGTRKSTQTTETDTLVLPNGSTQPVIVMQESPNIEGVLVVAEGAKDPGIQEEIHSTVCTLLHIPAAKVVVEAMGGF